MARLNNWLSSSRAWLVSANRFPLLLLALLWKLVARLANWLRTDRAWSVSANWFPLLLLALLWVLVAWCHLNLFPDTIPSALWPFFALGSTAYLLTLAYFLLSSGHDRLVGVSTRTAMALAMGAAMIFSVYAWNEWPKETNLPAGPASNQSNTSNLSNASKTTGSCSVAAPTPLSKAKPSSASNQITSSCVSIVSTPQNEIKSENGDSLNLVNIFAAILGIVLAAVALIAQKSAVDAKTEAEKARTDILEAFDIRILALSDRLLEQAQTATLKKEEFLQKKEEFSQIANHSILEHQNTIKFFDLGCDCLVRLSRFFSNLHRWILEPRIIPANDSVNMANIFLWKLDALDKAQKAVIDLSFKDESKQLRIEFWQPGIRLIERLLTIGLPKSAIPTEAEKVMLKLQEVRAMLDQL